MAIPSRNSALSFKRVGSWGVPLLVPFGQAALIAAVTLWALGAWNRDLEVPLAFVNDASYFVAQAKTTVENGWWWTSPRQAAPSVLHALMFPNAGSVDQAILWLISRVAASPTLSLNLAWIAMVALSGLTAAYGLGTLGFSRSASFVAGTLFAVVPCALYRQLDHFMLVVYLVPFPATAALHLASGRIPGDGTWKGFLPLLAGCALLGFNYPYYAFFGCFFVALGALMGFLSGRDRRVLGAGALCVATVVVCLALNLAPAVYAWSTEGKPLFASNKVPAEAEMYGLKIRQLISPVAEHRFPPFRAWTRREAAAGFPSETENMLSRLGLVPSVGFIALLATLLLTNGSTRQVRSHLRPAAALTVSGVLLATIGGFGSVFNLFVTPDIRGYNRISVFIAYFSLVAVAVCLDAAWRRRRGAGIVLSASVLVVGVWDQTQALAFSDHAKTENQREYRSLEAFVAQIEKTLPRGSMVLQLPFVIYLKEDMRARMHPYDPFKPYVVSHHVRWSYPALSNPQLQWQQAAARLAPLQLVPFVAARGFAAIVVDRFGYDDGGTEITNALGSVPGTTKLAESERYTAYDIRSAAGVMTAEAALEYEARTREPATTGMTPCAGDPLIFIDSIGDTNGISGPVSVRRSRDLTVSGWAVVPQRKSAAADVDVVIDATPYRAIYGLERVDVARHYGAPGYRFSGFSALIPRAGLARGTHTLLVRAVPRGGGACYYQSGGTTISVK